jgi:hypothetical protein
MKSPSQDIRFEIINEFTDVKPLVVVLAEVDIVTFDSRFDETICVAFSATCSQNTIGTAKDSFRMFEFLIKVRVAILNDAQSVNP